MQKIEIASLAAALAVAFAPVAALAQAGHGAHDHVAQAGAADKSAFTEGEVRKVDKAAGKITLKHGPIPSLDMATPMTMVFRAKDPAMLDKVKAGDKIRFKADKIQGAYTVTEIAPRK